MQQDSVVVLEEGGLGGHHGVAKAAEVGGVAYFLGEDIAGGDDPGDMGDAGPAILMAFTDLVLAEVQVLGALGGDRGVTVDTHLVVVVDGGALGGSEHRGPEPGA